MTRDEATVFLARFRCYGCGMAHGYWYIRDDGSPIAECTVCADEAVTGSRHDAEVVQAVLAAGWPDRRTP